MLMESVHWFAMMFPTSGQYLKIFMPILLFIISFLCVFSNILREPGSPYPLPSREDLRIELFGQSRIVYTFAIVAKRVTMFMNRIIMSKPYSWFYAFIKTSAKILGRLKGNKTKSAVIKITPPEPYEIDLEVFQNIKSNE